jgi:putative transcriptional regulator
MTILHHPDPATLAAYSAGTLGEALAAVVACHLDWCGPCASALHRFDAIGGELLRSAENAEMSAGALAAVMARLDSPAFSPPRKQTLVTTNKEIPRPLQKLVGSSLQALEWRMLAPGAKHIRLPLSNQSSGNLRLLKVAAGHKLPEHGHGGHELTLVLCGAYSDVTGTYRRGDISDLDTDAEHEPIATNDGECICLLASESKARFKGFISRLLQPIIGL